MNRLLKILTSMILTIYCVYLFALPGGGKMNNSSSISTETIPTTIEASSISTEANMQNKSVKENEKQKLYKEPGPLSVIGGIITDVGNGIVQFIFGWKGIFF